MALFENRSLEMVEKEMMGPEEAEKRETKMAEMLEKGEVQENRAPEFALLQFGDIPEGMMWTEEDKKQSEKRMERAKRMVMALEQEQAKKEDKCESEMEMPLEQDEGVRCIRQMCEMTTIDQQEMLSRYGNSSGNKVASAIAAYMAVREENSGKLLEKMLKDQNITLEVYAEAQSKLKVAEREMVIAEMIEKGEVQEKRGSEMALQFVGIPEGMIRTKEDRKRKVRAMRVVMAFEREQAKKEGKLESEMEMPLEQDEGVRCIRQMCEMTTLDQQEMLSRYGNSSGQKVAFAIASYMDVMEEDAGILLEEMLQDKNITPEVYAEAQSNLKVGN